MLEKQIILLAEDDQNDVVLMKMALTEEGLADRLQTVKDGSEAIQYLEAKGIFADRERHPFPCLLLLDLKMPKKNGFEVLAWIRAQPEIKQLVVVILTASKEEADIKKAYDLCANSYLVKPRTFDELLELVAKLKEYWLKLNQSPYCFPE